jgi:hypothetical protein
LSNRTQARCGPLFLPATRGKTTMSDSNAIRDAIERSKASGEVSGSGDCSLLRELADKVRDWYGLRGVAMDDASVLRMCVQDVEAEQAVYLRLEAPVVDLIRAVESVQDWGGTRVGEKIDAVESVLNFRY